MSATADSLKISSFSTSDLLSLEKRTKIEKAYDLAIAEIVKGANEKIKSAIEKGHRSSVLYCFYNNKDSETDKNNIIIRFDGLYLRNMIKMDSIRFFTKLSTYLNNQLNTNIYYCSYKIKKTESDGPCYKIYVSWGYSKVHDIAIAEIVKGANEKIKNDAEQGRSCSILYKFYLTNTKDEDVDKNGTRIRFGNRKIHILRMITKPERILFFQKLSAYFNNEANSSNYYCSFFDNKESDGSTAYNIFVSW